MIASLLLPLFLAAAPVAGATPPTPNPPAAGPVLHLDEAVRQALAMQPTLRGAEAQVQGAESRTDQARAGLLPQVSGSLTWQRGTSNQPPQRANVKAVNTGGLSGSFNGSLSAQQLVYDFGATTGRYRAAQQSAQAQRDAAATTREQVVLNVRAAFFNALANKALLQVAQETLANQRRHFGQIQGFVDVGARPRLDLAQARADVANAEVQRIQAENAYATAKVLLNQAIGLEGPADYDVADDRLAGVAGEDESSTALLGEALKARPEFTQYESLLRSQQLTLDSLRGSYGPSLGVGTALKAGGAKIDDLGVNWDFGATLTWPIFQGGLTRAQVGEAQAQLRLLESQRDALRQQVAVDVEQARLSLGAAKAGLVAAQESVQASRERLDLAEGRYQAGVGNIIELGDAQLAYTNAAAQKVRAEYSLEIARAQLLRALGRE